MEIIKGEEILMVKKLETIPEITKELPFNEKSCIEIMELIKENGFEEENKIVVWKGTNKIVDGAHRYEACKRLDTEPLIFEREFKTLKHAMIYAFRHQGNRRNFTASQILALNLKADDLEDSLGIEEEKEKAKKRISPGTNQYPAIKRSTTTSRETTKVPDSDSVKGETDEIIARKIGIGATTYRQGKKIKEHGIPELVDMMLHKDISADSGELLIKNVSKEEQKKIYDNGGATAIKKTVDNIKKDIKQKKEANKIDIAKQYNTETKSIELADKYKIPYEKLQTIEQQNKRDENIHTTCLRTWDGFYNCTCGLKFEIYESICAPRWCPQCGKIDSITKI
jgi:hypothetical protein